MNNQLCQIKLLNSDFCAVVDLSDYANLSQYRWRLSKSAKDGTGYATRWTRHNGKFYAIRMHREILDLPRNWEGRDTDHINGNKLDNRRENLRICSRGENIHNAKRINYSGFKGIGFHKASNKWRARIMKNGVSHWLGLFDSAETANTAYIDMSKKLYAQL